MQDNGSYGRINAAAQGTHDATRSDFGANLCRRFLDKRRHRPIASAPANAVGEIAKDLQTAFRVYNLGVKQQRVELARRIGHRRYRRVRARGHDLETIGSRRDEIAMTRPNPNLWWPFLEQHG